MRKPFDLLMNTKDGRMVASNAPNKIRATNSPAKLLAAVVQIVTMDQAMKLNMTQYLTRQRSIMLYLRLISLALTRKYNQGIRRQRLEYEL